MNDVFDKIRDGALKAKDEAGKLTKVAVKKTSNVVSKAKLTYAVSETEGKIDQLFAELGRILYNEYKNGAEFPENISQICQQAEKLYEEIDATKDQIAKIKNAVVCPACGEYNHEENVFCSKCGKRLKGQPAEEA